MKAVALALLALSATAVLGADNAPPGPPGTVTLPLAEYDRLVDRARDGGKLPPAPPVAAPPQQPIYESIPAGTTIPPDNLDPNAPVPSYPLSSGYVYRSC